MYFRVPKSTGSFEAMRTAYHVTRGEFPRPGGILVRGSTPSLAVWEVAGSILTLAKSHQKLFKMVLPLSSLDAQHLEDTTRTNSVGLHIMGGRGECDGAG